MNRLTGKRALVFGGDAIAQGIAVRFIQEGAHVQVVDDADGLAGFDAPGAEVHKLASRKPSAISAVVAKAVGADTLDVLVIGGGDIPSQDTWTGVEALAEENVSAALERNTAAALSFVKAAGSAIRAKGGSIIWLFNPAGLLSEAGWGEAPFVHHANRGLARALAMEWGPDQVRVNSLVPSANTPAFQAYRQRNPKLIDFRVSKSAMRRVGDPVKDIGGAAVFLASDDTRFLTGSMIFADGGMFLCTPAVDTGIPKV